MPTLKKEANPVVLMKSEFENQEKNCFLMKVRTIKMLMQGRKTMTL